MHNQVAEGTQRIVKASFLAAYGYFNPKFSQLYLNEYSALKGIRTYGLESLLNAQIVWNVDPRYSGSQDGAQRIAAPDYLRRKIAENEYIPPTVEEHGYYDYQNTRRQIRGKLRDLFNNNDYFEAKQAHIDYLNFWPEAPRWKRQHERKYGAAANRLWKVLSRHRSMLLSNVASEHGLSHPLLVRIAREWSRLNLAEVQEIARSGATGNKLHVRVRRKIDILPGLLYAWDMERYTEPDKTPPDSVEQLTRPERVGKSGMSAVKRTQYIEEMLR